MKVGIVGGKGRMGSLFADIFSRAGHECLISDIGSKLTNQELAERCEVIIFSVPISETVSAIESILPYCRKDHLLADLTSLKTLPVNTMLKAPSEVLGLHPLFGPIANPRGQRMIYCAARKREKTPNLLAVFESAGLVLKESTPEEHDHMMSVVQAVNHLSSVIFARTLTDKKFDLAKSREFATPLYSVRLDLIARILSQPAELYADLILDNCETFDMAEAWRAAFEKMLGILQRRDKPAFIEYFVEASEYFGDISDSAVERSERLIEFVVKKDQLKRN